MAHFAVVVLSLTLLLLSPPLASAAFSAVGGVLASRKHPKILVSGHVFCDQCRQGLSSQLTVPLQDAEVGVTCVDVYGFVTYNAVAYTSPDGSFKIPLDDLPPLYGVKGCKAHLVASGDFNCNLASSVGGGAAGAKLVLNSRSLEEVIFTSGPFAYHPSRPLRLCSPMSPSPPVTHRRLSPPPPAPSVRKHKSPPPPSGPKHKGKTPPSAAISYPPPPPSKPGQKKHKSPPPPATLKYRFPPGQAQPPPKPVNHGSKTPPTPDKRRPRSPKRQPPPPAPDKQNPKSPKPQPPAPSPVKAEKRKPPPPPRDHKPQPPSSVSPDQPVPPPHHGHQGHKSSPPAPPGYVYPSPPPPHHGHQGHPLPPPLSPGYVYTPPPPPHHGNEGHKDGKSPPKHNLPPLPQAPVPPPISR